jgi:DNA-binding transcriptional ArsR family regulator
MNLNIIPESDLEVSLPDPQTQIFKVLTHPTRLAILALLRDGEHCVCHLEAYLGLRQAYISQQLAVLRETGLVQDRREGWNIFYRITDPRIYDVLDAVRRITGQDEAEIEKSGVHCPCPSCNSAAEK